MSYTYDLRQDYEGFDALTVAQREMGRDVNERARAGEHGGDRFLTLMDSVGPAEDKAALAEVWGGPGAGAGFLP